MKFSKLVFIRLLIRQLSQLQTQLLSLALIFVLSISASNVFSSLGFSQTVVVKVIEERQEKRKSTRWTLTEWLHIKERMKMMDVWLAMFSEKKPSFTPELNLFYRSIAATSKLIDQEIDYDAVQMGAEIWLTNLVSASTGLRTLNIDLGFDGYSQKASNAYTLANEVDEPVDFKPEINSLNLNLRILGSHSQDTSLVIGYGSEVGISQLGWSDSQSLERVDYSGFSKKALLKLYVLNWLGLEGEYNLFEGTTSVGFGEVDFDKTRVRWGAFLEVSLLRFEYFMFETKTENSFGQEHEDYGRMLGLMLQL